MEIIIGVLIAVIGWLINHLLSIRAQKVMFINQLRNTARVELTSSLRNYLSLLDEIIQEINKLKFVDNYVNSGNSIEIQFNQYFMNLRRIIRKVDVWPNCHYVLEEYEPLLPQIVEAREYMKKKHVDVFLNFRKVLSELNLDMRHGEFVESLEKFDTFGINALKWIVKDFIVCIQNLILGKFTNHEIIQRKYPVPIKHPRLKLDKNNNIIIVS